MKREIETVHQDVFDNIKQLMDQARNRVSREVNTILVQIYLSQSHYCELLSISDEKKRSFYEKETIQANWSVKELKR